jgi:hypothetical protein
LQATSGNPISVKDSTIAISNGGSAAASVAISKIKFQLLMLILNDLVYLTHQ